MFEVIKTSKYTIKQILKDNWNEFYSLYKKRIRPVVIENVAKVMACGDKNILGYNTYVCPECGAKKYVAHTCKSRFCNACGKVKNDDWVETAQTRLFNIPHKHLVFSIPWEIRLLFLREQASLNLPTSICGSGYFRLGEVGSASARSGNGSTYFRV